MKKHILPFYFIFCFCGAMGMKPVLEKKELTKKSPEFIVILDNKKKYGYRKDHLTNCKVLFKLMTLFAINGFCVKSLKGGGGFSTKSENEIELMRHTEKEYLVTLQDNRILQGELLP